MLAAFFFDIKNIQLKSLARRIKEMNLAADKRSAKFWPGIFALIAIFTGSAALQTLAQQNNQTVKPTISSAEEKAAKKIEEAKTLDEKIKTAGDFVNKYPKSALRPRLADFIAGQILQTNDSQQIAARAETYFAIFNETSESDLILPNLINAYVNLKRHKEAFAAAEKYLARNPEDVSIRLQLAVEGSNLLRTGTKDYAAPARAYAVRAVELIEADKRPANIEEANWKDYRTKWLPQLYQTLGFLDFYSGDRKSAQTNFEKTLALNPKDVNSLVLLGSMQNDEYQEIARKHSAAAPGPERDALLKQAGEKMDKIIEIFARVVALTDGDPNAKTLNERVREDLESYYKFRNKNSTAGLQQLIDKYKNQ
jgi:tetratricopeptide (TPR) repeat protein